LHRDRWTLLVCPRAHPLLVRSAEIGFHHQQQAHSCKNGIRRAFTRHQSLFVLFAFSRDSIVKDATTSCSSDARRNERCANSAPLLGCCCYCNNDESARIYPWHTVFAFPLPSAFLIPPALTPPPPAIQNPFELSICVHVGLKIARRYGGEPALRSYE
ncbi:unnamed protein product, partial [Scytosiphon promiscuus]